jgi:hypothetical protein
MPAATPSIQKANRILSGSDPDALSSALEAVTGAESILEAIDNLQFLDDIGDAALIDEARAVLSALPESVDQAFLAAIENGLERGVLVTLAWSPADEIGIRISETTDGDGEINIVLSTPHGTTFTS